MDGPSLPVRRAAFIGVLSLVVISVLVTLLVDFRAGGYLLALALLAGGTARALLPDYLTLGLLVRSRQQDAATLFVLGLAVAVMARLVPG